MRTHPETSSPALARESRRKWIVVALLWFGACLNYVDRLTIFTVFPVIKKEMAVSDVILALFGSTFLWAYAASSPLCGYLGDRFNRKTIILWSLIIFSLVTFATGFAHTGAELIALRILLGISEALFLPSALAHIASFHTNATRSVANAIALTGLTVGAGFGAFFGGYMADYYSWRTGFYLLGIAGFILCVLFLLFLPARSELREQLTKPAAEPSAESLFAKVRAIFGTPTLTCFVLLAFTFSLTSWPLGSWGPTYLHERFSLTLTKAGAALALFASAPALVGGVLGGWCADRWVRRDSRGRLKLEIIALSLMAPTMALFGFMLSPGAWNVDLLIYSAGRGVVEMNSMPIFSMVTPPSRWSTTYGLYNLAGTLAGSLGVLFVGVMKSSWGIGYSMSFLSGLLFVAIALIAIVLVRFFARDMERNNELISSLNVKSAS